MLVSTPLPTFMLSVEGNVLNELVRHYTNSSTALYYTLHIDYSCVVQSLLHNITLNVAKMLPNTALNLKFT